MENISIAGSGKIAGGEYGEVKIAGSGAVTDSIRCESFSCAGSGHVHGDLDCTGKVGIAGSCHVDGNISAQEIKLSGSCRVDGNVRAEEIRVSGAVRVGGDMEAEHVRLSGGITMDGLLNAERIEIQPPSGGTSTIGTIGGTVIRVEREITGSDNRFLRTLFGKSSNFSGTLKTDVIEGDEIELDHVEANVVRGRTVVIHANTKIARVEYTESCTADEGAQIGETVKVE